MTRSKRMRGQGHMWTSGQANEGRKNVGKEQGNSGQGMRVLENG